MTHAFLDLISIFLVSSTVLVTSLLVCFFVIKVLACSRVSRKQNKWLYNTQSLLILISISVLFAVIAIYKFESISYCHQLLAKTISNFNTSRWISGSYIILLTSLLIKDLFLHLKIVRDIKNCETVENKLVFSLFLQKKRKLNLNQRVDLLSDPNNQAPVTVGLYSYKIILPKKFTQEEDLTKIDSVLTHELCHIKERDSFWYLLSFFSTRVLFFLPLIKIFSAKHRQSIEEAIDEAAIVSYGVNAKDYLKTMIDIAIFSNKKQNELPIQLSASAPFKELESRINLIKNHASNVSEYDLKLRVIPAAVLCLLSSFVLSTQVAAVITSQSKDRSDQMYCQRMQETEYINQFLYLNNDAKTCNASTHKDKLCRK